LSAGGDSVLPIAGSQAKLLEQFEGFHGEGRAMKQISSLTLSFAIGLAVMAQTVSTEAKVRIIPYAKSGAWTVRAVYASSGLFDHCSANTRYQSGTRVSIIAYKSGNWRLWFAHDAWPDRGTASFAAQVQVDGRTVLNQAGRYKNRNAYIDIGRDVSRIVALMRGNTMAIVTPTGVSRFSLNGTNQATRQVAGCWKAHYQRTTPGGAFGSANNATSGAFGGSNAGSGAFGGGVRKPSSNELSRAETLEIATSYLGKASQPYSILSPEKAPLKHFPVNWKMQDGSIGGMRVFGNTTTSVDGLLGTLLADQAKYCKGRNASQREAGKVIQGRQVARARCLRNKQRQDPQYYLQSCPARWSHGDDDHGDKIRRTGSE